MQKKYLVYLLIFVFTLSVIGCSSRDNEKDIADVELIPIDLEQMPEYFKNHLEELKQKETYKAFDFKGSVILFASRGELNTGGYDIDLVKAGLLENKLYVQVKKTDPKEGENVIQVITYPIVLKKVESENMPEKVIFIEGENLDNVIKEVEVEQIPEPKESVVTLYFGTKDGYLRKELRTITGLPDPEKGNLLIEELIKGTTETDGTLDVLPKGTKVLNYEYDKENNKAIVDLSEHVFAVSGSMGETLAVYSIVNTLTELPGIEKVQFLVEGEEVETIGGHIYLGDPIERDLQWIEGNLLK